MSAYHQMGHDSENLLLEPNLAGFRGAILSPVNYTEAESAGQVGAMRAVADFDTILDPQLYFPRTERGCLREWSYFPSDVDTADLTSLSWWSTLIDSLLISAERLQPTSVASPVVVPRAFSDEYLATTVEIGHILVDRLAGSGIHAVQSAVVGLHDLAVPSRAYAVASILSRTRARRLYLVLLGAGEPRRELADLEAIKGAMRLISALNGAGIEVLVGFASTDVLLWKLAGATHCASGKYFNLRRFTPARFEEPAGGGGQLPYWVEEALVAFLRESDLIRVRRAGLLSEASRRNPFGVEILQRLDVAPGEAWLAKSWRHYLWWFADVERRLSADGSLAAQILRTADTNWGAIEETILMEERHNNGTWVRVWRRACMEYLSGA